MIEAMDNHDAAPDTPEAERLLTTKETAMLLGVAPNTLAKARMEGSRRHPPHVVVGTRSVRYSLREISAFIRRRTAANTAQHGSM